MTSKMARPEARRDLRDCVRAPRRPRRRSPRRREIDSSPCGSSRAGARKVQVALVQAECHDADERADVFLPTGSTSEPPRDSGIGFGRGGDHVREPGRHAMGIPVSLQEFHSGVELGALRPEAPHRDLAEWCGWCIAATSGAVPDATPCRGVQLRGSGSEAMSRGRVLEHDGFDDVAGLTSVSSPDSARSRMMPRSVGKTMRPWRGSTAATWASKRSGSLHLLAVWRRPNRASAASHRGLVASCARVASPGVMSNGRELLATN